MMTTAVDGEKQLLEMVARGEALSPVLEALCLLVERGAPGCSCSVLVLDDETKTHLEHGAAPNLPVAFSRAIHRRAVAVDAGPCGRAAALNEEVIAHDIAKDERWQASGWSALALDNGFAACWSTPIVAAAAAAAAAATATATATATDGERSGRGVIGTFALYWSTPTSPTDVHRQLVERMSYLAAVAIERARVEAALERQRAFLAEAQRISATGSFRWQVTAAQIHWSEQTYRIYDLDPAVPVDFALVGTRIHPDESAWFQELLERAAATGEDLEFEHRLVIGDGSVRFLHVVASASRDRNGELEYIGAVRDVTDRHRADDVLNRLRSQLAHVARVATLGTLTASIAHELNQPLAGIATNAKTSLRMLAEQPADIEGACATARLTIRDAHRAAEVIARLRAMFAHQQSDAKSMETFDLNDATREVIAILSGELRRSRVSVHLELASSDLPQIFADRVQIQQVILNLVLNAIEAMTNSTSTSTSTGTNTSTNASITVRTSTTADARDVQLSVEDSGAGFDPADANRLFEPFFTTKREGMGVGLSISQSIMTSHGGRLWASRNDGAGSTFGFAVPVERSAPHRRKNDPPAHQ